MIAAVSKLRKIIFVESAGHWIQQERAAEVNDELLDFLRRELKQGVNLKKTSAVHSQC
jgi:pimeloyl-ACP methyl ester carboxylesterase